MYTFFAISMICLTVILILRMLKSDGRDIEIRILGITISLKTHDSKRIIKFYRGK